MAGSASNWYKVSGGPLKGQTVYISKAQRGVLLHSGVHALLNSGAKNWVPKANAQLPKGVAKSGRQAADAIKAKAKTPKAAQPRLSFADVNEASTFARGHYSAWAQKMTTTHPEQEYALRSYQSSAFSYINRALREKRPPSEGYDVIANNLDAAIKSAPGLLAGITVYRGMSSATDGVRALLDSWQAGKSYRDPGFLSTSLDKKVPNDFIGGGGVTMEIRVPKGQKAVYMQARPDRDKDYDGEQEMLLPRNTRYRIVSKEPGPKGSTHIIMEVY